MEDPKFSFDGEQWHYHETRTEDGFRELLRHQFGFDLRDFDIFMLSINPGQHYDHLQRFRRNAWTSYETNNSLALTISVDLMDVVKGLFPQAIDGNKFNWRQKENGFRAHEDDAIRHKQWCTWQAMKISELPSFGDKSKQYQARFLKKIHNIEDDVGTIAKRIAPLPKPRKTRAK